MSRSRVHPILRQQLRLYPYKMQLTQRLHRWDKAKRLRFCRWILGKWGSPSFRRSLLFSDEAHFYLNGQVLKQNSRACGGGKSSRPRGARVNPHCVVRSVFPRDNWPLLFQSRGRTVTVTGTRYKGMLDHFLVPALRRRHIPRCRVWFQQDGASPHTTSAVLARLHSLFPEKVLLNGETVPIKSPDLSPLDFSWGQLEAAVLANPCAD